MYCIHCGTLLPDGARFCLSCGTQVTVISKNATSMDQHLNPGIGNVTQDKSELQKKESKLTTEAADVVLRTSHLTLSWKRILIVVLGIMVIAIPFIYKGIILNSQYKEAEEFAANGSFREAIAAFEDLGEYKDSAGQVKQMSIALAEEFLLQGDIVHAAMAYGKAGEYELSCELYWDKVTTGKTIAVEQDDVIAVKIDGTVVVSDRGSVYGAAAYWTDIVAVSVSSPTLTSIYDGIVTNNAAVVGLKSDGTIIIAGKEDEIDLSEFMDVKIH